MFGSVQSVDIEGASCTRNPWVFVPIPGNTEMNMFRVKDFITNYADANHMDNITILWIQNMYSTKPKVCFVDIDNNL